MKETYKNKMAHIATIVADYYSVDYYKIFTKSRREELVTVRQVTMYISRTALKYPHKQLGDFFNRDHATSVHACKTIANLLETSKDVRKDFSEIRLKLLHSGLEVREYVMPKERKYCFRTTYGIAS